MMEDIAPLPMVVHNAEGGIALLSVIGKNKLYNNIYINEKSFVKQAKTKYIHTYINLK